MIAMPKGLLSKTLYTDFYQISSYRSNKIIHKSFMKFELVILNFKVVNRGVGLTTTITYLECGKKRKRNKKRKRKKKRKF